MTLGSAPTEPPRWGGPPSPRRRWLARGWQRARAPFAFLLITAAASAVVVVGLHKLGWWHDVTTGDANPDDGSGDKGAPNWVYGVVIPIVFIVGLVYSAWASLRQRRRR